MATLSRSERHFCFSITVLCVLLVIVNAYYISTWYRFVAVNIAGMIVVSFVGLLFGSLWLEEWQDIRRGGSGSYIRKNGKWQDCKTGKFVDL
jgi:hypothetical protein